MGGSDERGGVLPLFGRSSFAGNPAFDCFNYIYNNLEFRFGLAMRGQFFEVISTLESQEECKVDCCWHRFVSFDPGDPRYREKKTQENVYRAFLWKATSKSHLVGQGLLVPLRQLRSEISARTAPVSTEIQPHHLSLERLRGFDWPV